VPYKKQGTYFFNDGDDVQDDDDGDGDEHDAGSMFQPLRCQILTSQA
jgi:hypothetical protein